jgi:hypothetical protein
LISRIKLKITLLLKELSSVLSKRQVVSILGSFAIFFGFSMSNSANAQSFSTQVTNPFGLQPDPEAISATLVDLDNDGDLDIIQGTRYGAFNYFQNTGTAQNPAFSAPVVNPFGLNSSIYLALVATADLDNDGDMDLLVGGYYGVLNYFENTGTVSSPAFAPAVENPFGLTSTYYFSSPSFADMDNDGDFDLLVGEYYGVLNYFENTGTTNSPAFAAVVQNPFGITSTNQYNMPTAVDLDGDGDLDLLSGEDYGNFQYFQNIGNASAPAFAAPIMNPFGITASTELSIPGFRDLDNDGDLDLLVTVPDNTSHLAYYENTSNSAGIEALNLDMAVSPNPFTTEINFSSEMEHVTLFSTSGQEIMSKNKPGNKLNLKALNSGFYMLHVTDKKGVTSVVKIQKI